MKIFIKYMVSLRCKMIVRDELKKLGLNQIHIQLGEAQFTEDINAEQRVKIRSALAPFGLELLDNKSTILIEKIKNVVVENIHYSDEKPKIKFSTYLSEKLKYDYSYLSDLFSATEGITIEHFMLVHKIERVKELLIYEELDLTEIAVRLRYSSVAQLSNQFKNLTGLTPTFFSSLRIKRQTYFENP